ncbi:Hypothetical protein ING2D1G_0703 [Peptoniphilus sp. ING2-D1G]|nr:Hypothetical protein ING2D1G_0703 [Peptoniphilus sp. ING2-D1G]
MKVKAVIEFFDLKEKKLRGVGDEFEVSNERFSEILTKGGKWIEEVKEIEKAEEKELTISEIKSMLDEKGIKYAKGAKKDELLSLLND